MSNFESERPSLDVNSAISELSALLGQMSTEGAVDSERESIERLIEDVREARLTPDDAVSTARRLMESRQNYH